jgi:hypothetical protein
MSKPSVGKVQKQKERQRRIAKKKHNATDHKIYAGNFPKFELCTNNAPVEFVDLIRRTLRDVDFRDRTLFDSAETKFMKLMKRKPGFVIPALVNGLVHQNPIAFRLATMVGTRVFSRIDPEQLREWIPFNDVRFDMAGEKIVVVFRSLEHHKTRAGTIYFSPFRPVVNINGNDLTVGWSRHAIERICERLVPHWDSYFGLGDVFELLYSCRRFDSCQLNGGRDTGFTFYARCVHGYFSDYVAQQVLGRVSNNMCYSRVGYCPIVIDEGFAKATTLLYPGYTGTPEYGLMLRNGMPGMTRQQLLETAGRMTRAELEKTQDFSLLKMFHDNGVPQILETNESFYSML